MSDTNVLISIYLCYGDGIYRTFHPYPPHFQLYTPQLTEGDLSHGEPGGELLIELFLHIGWFDIFNDAGL